MLDLVVYFYSANAKLLSATDNRSNEGEMTSSTAKLKSKFWALKFLQKKVLKNELDSNNNAFLKIA